MAHQQAGPSHAAAAGGTAPSSASAQQGHKLSFGEMHCEWHEAVKRKVKYDAVSELETMHQAFDQANRIRRTAAFSGDAFDPNSQPTDTSDFNNDLVMNVLNNIAKTLYTNTAPPQPRRAADDFNSASFTADRTRFTFRVFLQPPVLKKSSSHARRMLPNSNKRRQRKQSRNTVIGKAHLLFQATGIVASPCLVVSPARARATDGMHLDSNGYLKVDLLRRARTKKGVQVGSVSEYAHRLVLIATRGWDKPERELVNAEVCHLCHNPRCLHPLHLAWGEHADNVMNEWSFHGRNHKRHFTKMKSKKKKLLEQDQGTTHKRRACFRPSAAYKATTRNTRKGQAAA